MARFFRPKALEMVEVEFRETLALAYLLVRLGWPGYAPGPDRRTSFLALEERGSVRSVLRGWLQVPSAEVTERAQVRSRAALARRAPARPRGQRPGLHCAGAWRPLGCPLAPGRAARRRRPTGRRDGPQDGHKRGSWSLPGRLKLGAAEGVGFGVPSPAHLAGTSGRRFLRWFPTPVTFPVLAHDRADEWADSTPATRVSARHARPPQFHAAPVPCAGAAPCVRGRRCQPSPRGRRCRTDGQWAQSTGRT